MRKPKKLKAKKLFGRLISYYIWFSVTITCIAVLVFGFIFYRTVGPVEEVLSPGIRGNEIVKSDYKQIDASFIQSIGGWVEIVNQERQVIHIIGEKKAGPMQYDRIQWQKLFYDSKEKPYYVSSAPIPGTNEQLLAVVFVSSEHAIHETLLHKMAEEINKDFYHSLPIGAVLLIILFMVNLFIYGRLASKRVTRPLKSILEGLHSIVDGQYDKRLQYSGDYELQQIQDYFNTMAEKLEQAEQMKHEMEASKQRMLTGISHDLRTPITTIQGYTQALQMGLIETEEKRQQVLTTMLQKSQRVSELIDDFFELSKLESSDYPCELEQTDLSEFIREIAAEYYPLFEEQKFVFNYYIPSNTVSVPANSRLLYRAVSNLLSNAIRYNPSGTTVSILLDVMPLEVLIRVEDNGVGIAEELRPTIFDAFTRGDRARKSDGGTGLGLTIAKHIVEKHNGEIILHSIVGKTVFDIWLPIQQTKQTKEKVVSSAVQRKHIKDNDCLEL
ncbi:HAMP domain-containing histidine kinase [Paenibacillus sp. SC116]|uniref:sensor histidine kinase n=1 Tax=Paenibacillus sp. SC116 TaxID=2968986 RepID=UPI00215B2061|nr:HAMP domain-containing sensor histidine kinase [Paenibacillus sp. SC116]MCR8844629.1 HAMP domain-containing histidine kinase [Paenibacillus sp. SC116]